MRALFLLLCPSLSVYLRKYSSKSYGWFKKTNVDNREEEEDEEEEKLHNAAEIERY